MTARRLDGSRRRGAGVRGAAAALLLAGLLALPAAQAHLIDAQSGTLHFVGDGAYLVLSLPVSALSGVDDDGDGRLSPAELLRHRAAVEAQLRDGLLLSDGDGPRPLQGLMLELASDPATAPASGFGAESPASQLVVLGRYALAGPDAAESPLLLTVALYGAAADEQRLRYRVTQQFHSQQLLFTPQQPRQTVLLTPRAHWLRAKAWLAEQGRSERGFALGWLALFALVAAGATRLARVRDDDAAVVNRPARGAPGAGARTGSAR